MIDSSVATLVAELTSRDQQRVDALRDAFRNQHRTHQQTILTYAFAIISEAARLREEDRYDLRNKAGTERALRIARAVSDLDDPLPYV